ncbi:hypothetical protein OSTOST_11564 [Ostertagia ostertagi]
MNAEHSVITDPSLIVNEWEDLFRTQSESSLSRMIIDGELDLCQAPPMPQHEEMLTRLAQVQAQILGIWDAIAAEDERTLKQLLFQKDMALCRDQHGRTPLHLAYRRAYQPCIDYLLKLAPEAELIRDKKGRLPRDYASKLTSKDGSKRDVRRVSLTSSLVRFFTS